MYGEDWEERKLNLYDEVALGAGWADLCFSRDTMWADISFLELWEYMYREVLLGLYYTCSRHGVVLAINGNFLSSDYHCLLHFHHLLPFLVYLRLSNDHANESLTR